MGAVICTSDEHAAIVGGATQLVVPGDEANLESFIKDGTHSVAPQRWVDATGPCPTCGGTGITQRNQYIQGLPRRFSVPCPNPDCIDGRKRVALAAPCRYNPGSVVFAHSTVEVLPVVDAVDSVVFVVLLDNVEMTP